VCDLRIFGRPLALLHPIVANHVRDAQAIVAEDARPALGLRGAVRFEIAPLRDRFFIAPERERENAVLAAQALEALALCEFIVLAAGRIGGQAGAVFLIRRQIFDVVHTVRHCRRSLVRREIADQISAAAGNGFAPDARIALEFRLFEWIDTVTNKTGDHVSPPDLA
jgi:hypothetical protein